MYSDSFVRIVDAPDTGDRLGVYHVFGAEHQDRLGEYLVVLVEVAPWVVFSVVVVELWLVWWSFDHSLKTVASDSPP